MFPVSMFYSIAEPDTVYDKFDHLLRYFLLYMLLTYIVFFLNQAGYAFDIKGFNHMDRNSMCNMWDRNRYNLKQLFFL